MGARSKTKLTKSILDHAEYVGDGKSRCFIWDSEIPGFGLRVTPSGYKCFVLNYYPQGRNRLMTIGAYGSLTLIQARKLAQDELYKIKHGADPLAVREVERSADTVEQFCREYLERHAKTKKRTWMKDESRIRRHIIPAWGTQKLSAITGRDVSRLHSKVGEQTPIEANRLLQQLSKMFNLAKRWGILDHSHPNPAAGLEKFRERKRDRFLSRDEASRFFTAVKREPSLYVQAIFFLLVLLGPRKSELLNAKWEDVDFSNQRLRLPETKNGDVHYIPLPTHAITILRNLPRQLYHPYVFPGSKSGRPINNIDKAWGRIKEQAGLNDLRIHDLRRTLGSWMAQSGVPLQLIGKVLNHKDIKTTQIYARFAQNHVKDALEQHGRSIVEIANPDFLRLGVDPLKMKVSE